MTRSTCRPTRPPARRLTLLLLALAGPLLGASCQTTKAKLEPGVDPTGWSSVYVVRHERDTNGIDRYIMDGLRAQGITAMAGPESSLPSDAQVRVDYTDRWAWDLTMYLRSLEIEFRDVQGLALLAKCEAYRDSLTRETAETVARKLVDELFGGGTFEPETNRSHDYD